MITRERVRRSHRPTDAPPMNILLVNYGPYDNNSGIHISGFAYALIDLGHRVVISAAGALGEYDADPAAPSCSNVSHRRIRDNPGVLAEFFRGEAPDLVHCWTPRREHRSVVRVVTGKYKCPYIVHFEDNEMAIARANGTAPKPGSRGTQRGAPSDRLLPDDHEFVVGAAGVTIIVDPLREVLPAGLPIHLLQPGVDSNLFAPSCDAAERARLREAFDLPSDARIIVYPGNLHPANADDMFSLYAAVHALNAQGCHVHLIRSGTDHIAVIDPRFAKLSMRHVTHLGWVSRDRLIKILKLADFFVQPGGPDEFNNYRLPSKLPELLAMGRPVVMPQTNIGLLMQDQVNAILMQRGDAAEITQCVEALLNDPALAERVGREGRRFAIEHFNWSSSATQLVAFYRRLLRR